MKYTENSKYKLMYRKGHVSYSNGKNVWVRTRWTVVDLQGKELWSLEGKMFNKHKEELRNKFQLIVKLN